MCFRLSNAVWRLTTGISEFRCDADSCRPAPGPLHTGTRRPGRGPDQTEQPKETSVDETFASDFRTVYISERTRDEEFGIFRSRFNAELYNLSFYDRILEILDQFIYIYQNLWVKFRLGGRFGEGERFCKKGVWWIKGESFIKPSVCSMIKIAVVCNELSCRNNRCGLIPDSNFSPCTMLAKIVWKKKKNRKLKLVPTNVRTSEIFFIPQIFPSFS